MFRTPWEADPVPVAAPAPLPPLLADPKPRGRRPAPSRQGPTPARSAWLYHHLTVTGPATVTRDFAVAARGPGVTRGGSTARRWLEEDVFNLAVAQPLDRVEARQARTAALVGHSQACPFDLHALLPVPDAILRHGPTHPAALAWLAPYWGAGDGLRHVAERPHPRPGRRLPRDHAVIGYDFFTGGDDRRAGPCWPALRLALHPRPD